MLVPYYTVALYGEARFEISRSVFLSCAARVASEEEAVAFISLVKNKNRDATHNCSAYIVGNRAEAQKADDDGEPSGTAGKPLLEVIKKQGLTDTVIVVTRYFGGVKLGAGGLIRAYGKAASEAVRAAKIVHMQPRVRVAITCDYSMLAILENNLRNRGYTLTDKNFAAQVTLYVLRRPEDTSFGQHIADWTAGSARIQEEGEVYVEMVKVVATSDKD